MLKKKVKKGTNIEASRRVMEGIDGDSKWFKVKTGENRIRILPSNREDGAIVVKSILHYGFKVDGKNRVFPCMSSLGKPCPVCKLISHHDSDTDPDVQDLIKQIGPRKGFLFNVLDRKSNENVVKIMSVGVTVAREINNLLNDDDYRDFTDPESGRDIKITRTGEGFGTKYSTRVAPKESAIGDIEWEDQRHNLEKERYIEIPSSKTYLKYIDLAFGNVLDMSALGVTDKEDDDSEESEEEDDADEDMEDDDDSDEEDENSTDRKAKLTRPKKVLKRKKVRSSEDL
jgi:hypothetical protein